VFGLPTGSAVKKIVRSASAGPIADALYNRAGLFPLARFQSVYAQLAVRDAYWRRSGDTPLELRRDVIRNAVAAVRAVPVWPQVTPSQRPELFIRGIHLHHSADVAALLALDVNTPAANVCVADASVYEDIGPIITLQADCRGVPASAEQCMRGAFTTALRDLAPSRAIAWE
jgi:hypothetical protein